MKKHHCEQCEIDSKLEKEFYEGREQVSEKCLHDACEKCHGTGRDINGYECIHMLSCKCTKCAPVVM